ncbi:hypothetical protein GCM10010168_78790 [Actinoplanes ianthinogenes]|uniref:non-specific serine/threonine protein kinase n=1 Tax=Actinoplanes ianthinogenes TaxID=122358 RepID=A0ABM7LK76_9ACTN|nr:serine/threonine-protein kinase [Actinoplanes ianthinogenes]BCJ39666.1 hypothetical protein Aiant_03230 [Actinoplanes ianthinogenes]GGR48238.1 hypothetical protein GCM10010168_78790 [Actinoplanes ianthinogenes]
MLIDGRYRLLGRLGQGGMSVVWRAEDEVLGREVAVKVLSARLTADPRLLRQLHAEARAAAGLRHATVVQVYDYGETAYRGAVLPYVVMELVDGRTLTELLGGTALPWRRAVLIGAQVAAALAAAHERGVVHRDVKPGNVMVGPSGVKLVDFGISAAAGATDEDQGQVLGTPAYLAPERIRGGPVRPATDVYALGLLLYQCLAGRMPWDASTATQMLRAHYYAEPAPLPDVPGLPPAVAGLVARCLAKAPDERPAAAELARALSEIAARPPATVRTPSPRRRALAVCGTAAALVAVTGLAVADAGEPSTPTPAAAAPAPSSPVPSPVSTPVTRTVKLTLVGAPRPVAKPAQPAKKPEPAPKAKDKGKQKGKAKGKGKP